MIIMSYLGESKELQDLEATRLLIVRKPPKVMPEEFHHVPELSPSLELFHQAQIWKREYEAKEDWFPLYEERFLKEIKHRTDMVHMFNQLERKSKNGKTFILYCYCKDIEFCHRKYVAEEFMIRGCEVDLRKKEAVKKEVEQLSLFD